MIVHTIRAALAAVRIDRVIVSTNDPAVATVARRAGAEVPFLRPDQLAADDTPTLEVIRHAVDWLEARGQRVDTVVTLQPTSPLRGAPEIDAVIGLLDDGVTRSAVSVAELGMPISVVGALIDGRFLAAAAGGDMRRQAAPPAVRLTGSTYVTRRDLLAEGRLLDDRPAAVLATRSSAIDVDDAADLLAARRAFRARRVGSADVGG